ncbi:STAS domain-containing protein [Loktanella sp. M215]|uniref:STAS domain-containing protein n=1 Tax=Loktanella sp. M215 TaxID=2675431 RepID=UPI001F2A28C6|nr:STAS domain-containing protein [Loktanella sp. M215]MCF7699512.1 STAS domain-containing protein [Loktanella sp. M215]
MPQTLTLPDKLDTAAAPRFLSDLLAVRGEALTLDAANCRGVGAICAQILLAAQIAWRGDGCDFTLQGHSGISNDLTILGLADLAAELETRQ